MGIVIGERSAAGSRGESGLTLTAMRALANVKPVANWLDAALTSSYKNIYKCKLKGDDKGLAEARRNVARLRAKAGLEG